LPRLAQKPDPVAVQDLLDVGRAVAAAGEQIGQAGQVGDGVQVRRGSVPTPLWRALPANWQTWSMWSTMCSSVTPASIGLVLPRTQPGTIIQASRAAPITAPRSISSLSCSSLNCRSCGTRARQLEWLAQTGPS
jgi:hypothetical protein